MRSRRVWIVAGAVCAVAWAAAWSPAATGALDLVPEKAIGFVAVNGLERVDAKITQLGQTLQMPVPGVLMMVKAKVGVEKGIDEKGIAALVAMPGDSPDAKPEPVILIPVADFDAFIGQFKPEKVTDAIWKIEVAGARSLAAHKGGHAVLVEHSNQELLEAVLGSKSLADDLGQWKSWVEGCDVVAVGTKPAVAMFAEKANEAMEQAKEGIKTMGEQGEPALAAFEMYQKLLGVAKDEVTAAGVGLVIEEDGSLKLSGRGRFAPEGELTKYLANVEPLPENPVAVLPKGPYLMAGGGPVPEALVKPMMDMSFDMVKNMPKVYGLDEAQAKQMIELSMDAIKGLRGGSMTLGVPKAGAPLYNGAIGVMFAADAEAFLDRYVTAMNTMVKATADSPQSMFKGMTVEKTTLGDRAAVKVTTDMSAMLTQLEDSPIRDMQVQMFKRMYGEDMKISMYFMAADSTHVVFSYGDPDRLTAAAAVVANPAEGLASDANLTKTAGHLPAGAQWVGYWSPEGTVAFANSFLSSMAELGAGFQLPPMPTTPPIGLAVKVSSTGVEKEMYVPIDAVRNVVRYVTMLQMNFAQ